MENIKLFRITIKEARRLGMRFAPKPTDTHLISIQCMIEGNRFSTDVIGLYPKELKNVYKFLINEILKEHKKYKNSLT